MGEADRRPPQRRETGGHPVHSGLGSLAAMVLLWTVPVLAVAAAAVVVLVLAEAMHDSSRALRDEVMRLESLREAVAGVRAEAERLRR